MKIVRLFDIRWDTDGEDPNELGLPPEIIVIVDDDWTVEENAADSLSDQYGFCVEGCSFTVLTNPNLGETGFELNDGGVIQYPDSEGTIRRLDQFGNCEEVREPTDANYGEWKQLFEYRWTVKTLRRAIRDNQRFHKYERTLRRIRLRVFQYEDEGRSAKAQHIVERIKRICGPMWEKRAKRLENEALARRIQ